MTPFPPPGPRLLGPLLAELRLARRWSQQRIAAELCAASGVPTLTRHEVSRWERQLRLPGDFWLGWLAVVLDVPGELLTEAAARSRTPGGTAATARGGSRSRAALLALAQRWLADPSAAALGGPALGRLAGPTPAGPTDGPGVVGPDPAGAGPETAGAGPETAGAGPAAPGPGLRAGPGGSGPDVAEMAELRRWDDLLGGADLAAHAARRLRRTARALSGAGPGTRGRLLPALAEAAQLAGWLAADAGDLTGGLDAYRLALRAALAAGDPALAGHVLGSASHLLAGAGDPEGALALARTGYAGARGAASPGLRALLLHRVALAAALGGRQRAARQALTAAGRLAGPDPGREPPWLYWLDDAELAAMTGRTLVALGRPGPAAALLRPAVHGRGRPRRAAVYGAWLARGHLQLGEVEQACAVAGDALLDAVRSGSPRAVGQLTDVRRRLASYRDEPAVRGYAALLAAARPYLPVGAAATPGPARARPPRSAPSAARRHGGTTRPAGTG
ncbi:transcriptional regulator [Micromonospora sp. 4G57]|uniref:Transcriptional regulator n=1 Tax=Micromonospora sicca TaxID=2202420 RepID=A0ABU5JHW9_9ACTN|nr:MULTISPECIES: transcriptional regulator [unclassified Micromonospora]MDZ5442719.1 transcriptional regulator [Micromonospora sp. 4G57]MDZ5492181.1 transcriptional regulator [Micromonospora sp. 4G53]